MRRICLSSAGLPRFLLDGGSGDRQEPHHDLRPKDDGAYVVKVQDRDRCCLLLLRQRFLTSVGRLHRKGG